MQNLTNKKNRIKKSLSSFPITYNAYQIKKETFLTAVEKLMQKFGIKQDRAIELAEDIIKAMITEHKNSITLKHEINSLSYAGCGFSREESIQKVIEKIFK